MKVTMPDELRKPEPAFDSLDELLAKADWPQPSALSKQRLEQHWRTISSSRAMTIHWPSLTAVAALLIVVLGIWRWQPMNSSLQIRSNVQPVAILVPTASINAGRPATNIELAMLRVVNHQHPSTVQPFAAPPRGIPLVPLVTGWQTTEPSNTQTTSATIVSQPIPVTLLFQQIVAVKDSQQRDHLLDDLVTQGPTRARDTLFNLLADQSTAAAATTALSRHPAGWTEILFAALNEPRVSVRLHAAAALAQIDGPVITTRLITMADTNISRREAVTALVQINSTQARQFVAVAKRSPDLSGLVRSVIAQNLSNQSQAGVLQ
jgi:hypothetical protein